MAGFRVVLVTAPAGAKAERLAKGAVAAGLAACVNVVPGVVSHYRWKGRLERGRESLLLLKTSAARLAALERWVKANHPYSLPEFVALKVDSGSREYLAWLGAETR